MTHPDFSLRALYDALDNKRREGNLSWAEAARQINRSLTVGRPIALLTITGLKTKRVAEGDGVLQMLLWLGRTPESFVADFPNADAPRYQLKPPVGRQILRWDTKALHAALNGRRQALGLTWDQVAKQVGGFTVGMLVNLAKGGRTGFPHVVRLSRWLNEPAATFAKPVRGHRENEVRNWRKRAQNQNHTDDSSR